MKSTRTAAALVLAVLLLTAWTASASPGRLALLDDARVDGPVQGDVVAIGGNVILGPGAHVDGHCVAVLGRIQAARGAVVTGRRITITSLAGLRLGGAAARSPRQSWGVRLLAVGFWLFVTTLLASLFTGRIIRGIWTVGRSPVSSLGLGVLAALTLLAALVAVFSVGPALGLPGAVILLLLFAAAKIGGLTLIGGLLGGPITRKLTGRIVAIPFQVAAGVVLLLAVRLVPVAGGAVWAAASIWGLGAAVTALAADPIRLLSPTPPG